MTNQNPNEMEQQNPSNRNTREEREKYYQNLFYDNVPAMFVYYILKYTDIPIFLTGKAGTGKSTLLELIKTISETVYILVAATGIAARNVEGQTIHSAFHLPHHFQLPTDEFINGVRFNELDATILCGADLVIIEEISMVSSPMLDCMDKICRKYGDEKKPFGGKKVLFVGDPFQLPPIINREDLPTLKEEYHSEHFFSAKVFSEMAPIKIELQETYRQKDQLFLEILNAIRTGMDLEKHLAILNKTCCYGKASDKEDHQKTNSIKLAFKNDVALLNNERELMNLPGEIVEFSANASGTPDWKQFCGEKQLKLKLGARVMLTKNHPQRIYVNGSLGTVQAFKEGEIDVLLDEGQLVSVGLEIWSTMKYEKAWNKLKCTKDYKEVGTIRQFPIKLAWAITVHKSQGLTFDNVHLINKESAFASGQVYVALSRCRSLEGLKLLNPINKADIKMDKKIVAFYESIVQDEERINQAFDSIKLV